MFNWRAHKGLVLSLAGNLLLAVAVVWALTARKPAAIPEISLQPSTQPQGETSLPWGRVRAADYADYVRNLRALGCPEASIVDLIVGEVTAQFSERWRTASHVAAVKYWETATTNSSAEQARLREVRARLQRERRELLLQVLGPPALQAMAKYRLWNDVDPDAELLAFLPASKREQLFVLQQKYPAHTAEDVAGASEEDMRRAAADQARQRAEIAALLSPQELEELDLRKSDTAQRLREELQGFQANEAEFRQLFRVRRAYEVTLAANPDVRDTNVLQVRIEAERRFAEEARAALGEQRYADYQRARDPDYQNALQVTQFYSLPGEVATRVYELKHDVDARAGAITANTALSETRRDELLGQLQADTERTLQSLLGGEVLAEYRRNNRWWIWND
jgi:hypothetical protein